MNNNYIRMNALPLRLPTTTKIKNRVGWDVSLFFNMDSKCKTFAHCVTTWSWRRPHSNKQRVLRDYGIVYQEFPKSLISLKAVEYKTRNLIMNSTFTSSTFPFRNGSTTPLAWRSAIFKCQPRHDNSSLKGKKTLNSQLMKSLGVEPTDVLNRQKSFRRNSFRTTRLAHGWIKGIKMDYCLGNKTTALNISFSITGVGVNNADKVGR